MKCPKCDYLGFETGNRCRNCGYDFSLLPLADAPPSRDDLVLRTGIDRQPGPAPADWLDPLIVPVTAPQRMAGSPAPAAGVAVASGIVPRARVEPALPLFPPAASGDEQPLITVPAAPRQPIAVRRTPDLQRKAAAAPVIRRDDARSIGSMEQGARETAAGGRLHEPRPQATVDADLYPDRPVPAPSRTRTIQVRAATAPAATGHDACPAGPRATAALIDTAILLAIDVVIVYFTVKMAALSMADWRLLPMLPLAVFLTVLKLAYFASFTAFGGQTIGKMAARIRVVSEDGGYLEPARAVQRTLVALGSVATLGAGFMPALVGPSRRALHDRLAHTCVVALRSA